MVIGSKQCVVDCTAYFYNGPDHTFTEALFVTDFLEKGDAANENNFLAQDLDLEDRTW